MSTQPAKKLTELQALRISVITLVVTSALLIATVGFFLAQDLQGVLFAGISSVILGIVGLILQIMTVLRVKKNQRAVPIVGIVVAALGIVLGFLTGGFLLLIALLMLSAS